MRNLKRALSLTLASVMLLGMMVVGAGAASYKDVSDDHNVEAIEVLQAVGAMIGDEAGNFDPDANVNRAQIATIMSRLLDLKVEDFNAADIPFTDVPEWAVPFVAACYADGITRGISDVLYGSNNDVTAVQAALMMMKALGYFQYQDDFEQDWQLATLKKASEIGLFSGVTVDRTSPLTRNDVAQMALNALKSNMVSFTGNVGSTYPVNGETVRVGYKPEYTPQTSADAIYNRIDVGTTNIAEDDRYYVQLGEYLYGGDLRLTSDIDVFGRPARHWEFEGTDIGTYVKEELLREQYTSGVTGKTVFDLLGRSMIQDSELFVYVDGDEKDTTLNTAKEIDKNDLVRSNDDDLDHTGRGVLTQVFVDTQNMEITIAVINTYLAQATTAYSEKNETISLKVYSSPIDSTTSGDVVKSVPLDDVPEIQGLANGDWMLVYLSNMDTANNVYRVVEIMDVEIVADVEIDEFSTKKVDKNDNYYNDGIDDDKDSVKTLVVGEDTYNRAYTQSYDRDVLKEYNDSALEDSTYNIYLDLYGNFIGVDLCEGTKNYVFIAGYDMNPSNITNRTAEALAIFPDGTMDNIRVDVKATNKNIERMYDTDLNADGTDDVYADVYRAWQANSYATLTGLPNGIFTYGTKNNPEEDDEGNKINYDGNVENLWYSYRATDKGVYTLTPVSHFTIDGWDGNDDETERNTIRTDSVALWHQNAKDDPLPIDHWGTERSYGNTDSVYIVGSNDDNDFNNQVIGTVDGLYTSVDKVNITYQEGDGWANAVVDGNGYVVAAVILGEAEGAVDNYAYILKGAYAERYDRTTGTTYHKFDVYMNGEIKTLTTKDTYEDCVPNIKVNHVQELVLDNDGMVTRVRDLPNAGCDETVGGVAHAHWQNSLISTYKHDVVCLGEDFNYKTGKEDSVYDHMEAVNGTRITDYSVYYMDTDKVLKSANGKDYLDLYFKGDTLYMKDPAVEGLDKAGLFVASDAHALLIDWDGGKTEFATAKDAYSNIVDADSTKDGLQFNGHVAAALDSTGKAVWVVFYDETEVSGWKDEYQKVTSRIYFAHPDTTDDQKLNDGTHNFAINSKDKWAGVNSEGDLGFEFYVKDNCANTATELAKQQLRIEYTVRIDSGRNSYVADQGRLDGVDITTGSTHNGEWFFRGTVYNRDYKVKTGDTVTVSIDKIWYVGDDPTDPTDPTEYKGYSQVDPVNKKVHVGLVGEDDPVSDAVLEDAKAALAGLGFKVDGAAKGATGWNINVGGNVYTTHLHTLYTLKPYAAPKARAIAGETEGVYIIDLTEPSSTEPNLTGETATGAAGAGVDVDLTGLDGKYLVLNPNATPADGNTSYGASDATGANEIDSGEVTLTGVKSTNFTKGVATYKDNLVAVSVDNGNSANLYEAGSKFYSAGFNTTNGTWTTDTNGVTNEIKTDSTGTYIVLGDEDIQYADENAMAGAARTFSITDPKKFSGKTMKELGADEGATTLTIDVAGAAGIGENQNAQIDVKSSADIAKAYTYTVTLTFNNGTSESVDLVKGSANTGGSIFVKMTEDLEITGVEITEKTPLFAVTEVTWDAGSVTFTFNLPVTEASAIDTNFTVTDKSGGTITISQVKQSNEGKTVTLVLTGEALVAGDEVTVTANVKTETAANTLAANVTFALAEGGTATVKP